ncbi:hypothetical protein DFH01_17420 [Falsiroseomonas bella]|uniref:Uncharacterized protein n=1 Tax=Falsiroseomonas bella TaxID=2184016 RepID=A0A317FA87_9PROT|nr:hypothetical protein [Falsiroseomonas bella]PWS35402.1 hypothetical protein DFH01_17420 [Falsiroseomonas bella]
MMHPARRSVLAVPMLALPGIAKAAPLPVPPFRDWIGRTARLRGDGGAARLFLGADGTGRMAVRLLLFCRILPVRAWRLGPDGVSLTYSRVAALDSSRLIAGEAHILPGAQRLLWVEAASHEAEFEGFETPDAAGRCG